VGTRCANHVTPLYPQKLAPTSPTGGGRSVGMVRSRTKSHGELCLCIANIFAEYNQQDATFHNFFISVRRSTFFRRFFHPPSGAENCTYSVRYLSDRSCYLPLATKLAAGSSIGYTL